jgi:hypothetical protein
VKDDKYTSISHPTFAFALPYYRPDSYVSPAVPYSEISLFLHCFILRPNFLFRIKMKSLIHDLRVRSAQYTQRFHSNVPCIAAHVRRGDRAIRGLDMIQFCYNQSYDAISTNTEKRGCANIQPGSNIPYFSICPYNLGDTYNFACDTVPFAAITLAHVVDKVEKLIYPIIRDIIVFSDDPASIDQEIKDLRLISPEWRIHSLRYPKITKTSKEMDEIRFVREGAGIESGVLFQSSLKLAQKCSGFIGHSRSAVSRMLFENMCIEHAGRYGVCPPFYDFNTQPL